MGNSIHETQPHDVARVSAFYRSGTWIEGRAEDQLNQVATWPGMAQIAAFPDLHPGRHGPVGAAFLADRIYPQLIGPDIGCGMALFRLDLPRRKLSLDKAAKRLRSLEEGTDAETAQAALEAAGVSGVFGPDGLGTIGGGNHFCEIQEVVHADPDTLLKAGTLCLLVHSGSRGYGASVFNGIENTWRDGFAVGSRAALDYVALHGAAQIWARVNRALLAQHVSAALRCEATLICDAPHNQLERMPDGWLHRKGAAAPDGGYAPLAGSRETASYLLKVLPDVADALGSVSHGAGRRYDRASMHGRIRKTKSSLASMAQTRFGGRVICENRDLMIEEAGAAYKNPAEIVADLQSLGLAEPVAEMAPLITYKTARTGGRL